jgi:6-pyruvoyltetrahydropterin/6-carboxytetrahydropterin synthase
MARARVTRRYRFSAAHRLHSPLLPEAANREVYGKCNNPYGHGHDYVLEVSVAGEIDPATGRVMPLALLDQLVQSVILRKLDRRNLNREVEEFATLVPTTENLAAVIARRLALAWGRNLPGQPARVEKVRIHETRNNIFEVRAPQGGGLSSLTTAAEAGAGMRESDEELQSAD